MKSLDYVKYVSVVSPIQAQTVYIWPCSFQSEVYYIEVKLLEKTSRIMIHFLAMAYMLRFLVVGILVLVERYWPDMIDVVPSVLLHA